MTGTILLAIFNSLLYCACTSVIRSQLGQASVLWPHSCTHTGSSTSAAVSRRTFRESWRGTASQSHSLRSGSSSAFLMWQGGWVWFLRTNDHGLCFFQCSSLNRRTEQELTVLILFSTEPAWILSLTGIPPSSVIRSWCHSTSSSSTGWTSSTLPAISIFTFTSRIRGKTTQVQEKYFIKGFLFWSVSFDSNHWLEEGEG